ncbi:hypothetical protein [Glaciimonas immobilis]|uniref:Uncharacterized protein n=1 Tax=Glaciimonas immobilis TaxID=728004 RepID=A0A840RVM0_9BURK|nr:hypothetical protein [Glaciimonas immobilis]KAF3999985.1 hypothetical protein HAV38_02070 [Glaciimonas immobilis]MBB5200489.1 hypothetical protein [Glaciimonas immobilis]
MNMTIIREYKGQKIVIFTRFEGKGWLIKVNLENGIEWTDTDTFVGSLEEVGLEGVKRGEQLIDNRL